MKKLKWNRTMPEEGTETAVLSNGHLGKMSLWL
jgi:hypothetical protein